MKSLEIKIALSCELFQNRFYFKDVQHELSSWSVRKFRNFWFHYIIDMKFFDKCTLFICHLFRLFIKNILKESQRFNNDF